MYVFWACLLTAAAAAQPLTLDDLLLHAADPQKQSAVKEVRWPAPTEMFPEGTLCLWAQPVDWQRGDGSNHSLVRIHGGNGYLSLFNLYYGMTRLWNGKAGVDTYAPQFAPGQWCFLAVTWRGDRIELYVNGVFAGQQDHNLTPLRAGDNAFIAVPGNAGTVFDDLMVFRRCLHAAEIRALYYRGIRQPTRLGDKEK